MRSLAIGVLLGLSGVALAAPVLFEAPVTVSGVGDISTVGTLKYAYHFANSGSDVTVAGVFFKLQKATLSDGALELSGTSTRTFADYYIDTIPANKLPAEYIALLKGAVRVSSESMMLTLKNLTPGRLYQLQVWAQDASGIKSTTQVSSMGGNTQILDPCSTDEMGGVGQYCCGYFAADGTEQAITFSAVGMGTRYAYLNALQVREMPESYYWRGTSNVLNLRNYSNYICFDDADGVESSILVEGVNPNVSLFFSNTNMSYRLQMTNLNVLSVSAAWQGQKGSVTIVGSNKVEYVTVSSNGVLSLSEGNFGRGFVYSGNLLANGLLSLECSTSCKFATVNALRGSGTFRKTGAGVLASTGGQSNFVGRIEIAEGVLRLEGNPICAASEVNILNRRATLDISGYAPNTVIPYVHGKGVLKTGFNKKRVARLEGEGMKVEFVDLPKLAYKTRYTALTADSVLGTFCPTLSLDWHLVVGADDKSLQLYSDGASVVTMD